MKGRALEKKGSGIPEKESGGGGTGRKKGSVGIETEKERAYDNIRPRMY